MAKTGISLVLLWVCYSMIDASIIKSMEKTALPLQEKRAFIASVTRLTTEIQNAVYNFYVSIIVI